MFKGYIIVKNTYKRDFTKLKFFHYSLSSQKDRQQPTIQPTNHLAVVLIDFANIVFWNSLFFFVNKQSTALLRISSQLYMKEKLLVLW